MDSSNKIKINLKIRRYDDSEDPVVIEKSVELEKNWEYCILKQKIQSICDIAVNESKLVIKLRQENEILIPFSALLENTDPNKFFYLDVCKINYNNKLTTTLLQDTYIDSVCQKLRSMESRITKTEMLLPQLEWRRQAHMEETVENLAFRVAFLNRRIDELLPNEWKGKMLQPVS